MRQMKHWQDPVNAVLGVWLVLSPWALGYTGTTAAMWNAVVIGVVLVAIALGAMTAPRAWEEWAEAALGLWMAISPWVLGFSGLTTVRNTALVTGLVILVLALWVLATDKEYTHWGDHGAAH